MEILEYDIQRLMPRFIREDKTGLALCQSIEAALNAFLSAAKDADDYLTDPALMPERFLDEAAWDNSVLYDYTASVEVKRRWIDDAIPMKRIYGTPEILEKYLLGVFDAYALDEWWEYDGDPYHFRITVGGDWTDEKRAWALTAVNIAKNARSIFDRLAIGSTVRIKASVSRAYWLAVYPMSGEHSAGIIPLISVEADLNPSDIDALTVGIGYTAPYPMCGTINASA
jgi:phage tail P2-like protein